MSHKSAKSAKMSPSPRRQSKTTSNKKSKPNQKPEPVDEPKLGKDQVGTSTGTDGSRPRGSGQRDADEGGSKGNGSKRSNHNAQAAEAMQPSPAEPRDEELKSRVSDLTGNSILEGNVQSSLRAFCITSLPVIAFFVLLLCASHPAYPEARRPSRLQLPSKMSDTDGRSEAERALVNLFDEITSQSLHPKRPAVLQLEIIDTAERRSQLADIITDIANLNEITVVKCEGNFDEADLSSAQPTLVIVHDSHTLSNSTLQSYYSVLAAYTYGMGDNRRTLGNVGFLFLGFSFQSESDCQNVNDIFDYYRGKLGWSETLLTRLTTAVAMC